MKAVIRKWGNSPALRLPVAVMKEANFSVEQKVTVIATRGRIVIEPSDVVEYDLDTLLARIRMDSSRFGSSSFGLPRRTSLLAL